MFSWAIVWTLSQEDVKWANLLNLYLNKLYCIKAIFYGWTQQYNVTQCGTKTLVSVTKVFLFIKEAMHMTATIYDLLLYMIHYSSSGFSRSSFC